MKLTKSKIHRYKNNNKQREKYIMIKNTKLKIQKYKNKVMDQKKIYWVVIII